MFNDIINNIALIVVLSLLYSFISRRWKGSAQAQQAAIGLLFGAIAIVGMMNPVAYAPGIIFDGRSIIISAVGFIAGPLAACIAAVLAAAYRYSMGGGGAVMGVSVIAASAIIGTVYYYMRRRHPVFNRTLYLYAFGIIVHLCMLSLTMLLPASVRFTTLKNIALPVILIYPAGTVLVCFFLLDQEIRVHMEAASRASEIKYRELVENANSIIIRWSQDCIITFINEFGLKFFGFAASELLGKHLVGTIIPETESTSRDLIRLMDNICAQPENFEHTTNENMRRNGDRVWVSWTNKIVFDDTGQIQEILSIGSDITKRKQSEKKLRENENAVRKKLNAIIEPEGDIGLLELSDIIDSEALQSMMDEFYRLTGLLCAILDVSGKILVAAGWQDICTKFHRCHPETLKNCIESDTILSEGVPDGTFKTYRCKNNMRDMVTPITVGGRHIGNFFIGQFFYDDEKVDVEVFRNQARRYGFDEAEYLAAYNRVPRLSRETVDAAMAFYAKLAEMIAKLSYSTIRLSRTLTERKRNEEINVSRMYLLQFSATHSLNELLEKTLNEAENLSDSCIGFYHFVDDDQKSLTLQNWSTRTKAEFCKAIGNGLHYAIDNAGVWVDCVYQRQPVIHNDYSSLPHRKGMPEGHAEVTRELVVPVIRGGKVVAILGVGNKPTDYTQKDIETISLLADLAWESAERTRAEEEIRKLNAELEQRVAERTEELTVSMEKAQDADRLKSAFLATMSHELRTPLNSIIGFTGILLQLLPGPLNEEQTKQLGMIRQSARHLLELINDVLDISKIEAGQLEISKEPFDMRLAVEDVLRTVTPLAAKKGLTLSAGIEDSVGSAMSDQRRVKQILLNLATNAVKFTASGDVHIDCRIRDNRLETSVRDTGMGIAPQDMDKLFKSFQQIDCGLTRNHEGTGLGLSICKKLVEMLGGRIAVESEPGVGSTFMFTLPVISSESGVGSRE